MSNYTFAYNGLTFGLGTQIKVNRVSGIEDLDVRLGDQAVPRGVGDVPGLATAAAKDVVLELSVVGDRDSQALSDLRQSVLLAFAPSNDEQPLYFYEPGMPGRFLYTRVIGRVVPRDPSLAFGMKRIVIRLKAADPRIYGEELKVRTVSIYDPVTGGADYPFDEGTDFTGGGSSTERVVVNLGDADAYPVIQFYGPGDGGTLTAVELLNTTTGESAEFSTTILGGQVLSAYMRRIVTASQADSPFVDLNGANRYGDWVLPRTPFRLVPGENVLRYLPTGTTNDTYASVSFRDTWL